jgi:SUMO ligase MMS21 Smc5/6 complex component
MIKEIYLKNARGEEITMITYETKEGAILKIEIFSETAEDWVEIAVTPPSFSAQWLIKVCQAKVEQDMVAHKEEINSWWNFDIKSLKARAE